VLRARAAAHAVLVAGLALAVIVVVLAQWTLFHAVRPVVDIAALGTVARPRAKALAQAFLVAAFTHVVTGIVDPMQINGKHFASSGVQLYVWRKGASISLSLSLSLSVCPPSYMEKCKRPCPGQQPVVKVEKVEIALFGHHAETPVVKPTS